MRITLLTVGSRGDIQPYIALGMGLKAAGHDIRIATETRYQDWITQTGFEFAPLPGDSKTRHADPEWLTFLESTRHSVIRSMRQCNLKFLLPTLPDFLDATWDACQGTDAIISTPGIFGSYHIAEKLGVPYYRTWTNPFIRTREFPHAWARFPLQRWLNGSVNLLSYQLVDLIFFQTLAEPINQWRLDRLQLPPVGSQPGDMQRLQTIPTLCNYSPTVLPKPADWDEYVHVTGYWFLDQPGSPHLPQDLVTFLQAGPPPLYIGFGSIADRHPKAMLETAIAAVCRTGQRAVIEAGWAGFGATQFPAQIFPLAAGSVPHQWLFPQMSAIVHHGGAGTTGASLRAGKPTLVVYQQFSDYYFWGQRIAQLGAGPKPILKEKMTVDRLAKALHTLVTDAALPTRAAHLGERIRSEDGVAQAVKAFHHHLPDRVRLPVTSS